MANSVEVRVPLLDREVIQWAFRLSGAVLLPRGAPNKPLLRAAARPFFSEQQLTAPKQGFLVPVGRWLQGPLREVAEAGREALGAAGLVDRTALDSLARTVAADRHPRAWSRQWLFVVLGTWLRNRHRGPVGRNATACETEQIEA
jgi:asparagine synthase (glutamine-hydrolysing)